MAVGLTTQTDWRNLIKVVRRNTPAHLRWHSEFESVANECLAEAIRDFDPDKGIPFEGFLAHVASRRVPKALHRITSSEGRTSPAGDSVLSYLDLRVDLLDNVAPQRHDAIAEVDSLDAVHQFIATLSGAEHETALLLAYGLKPTEVARERGVTRSAVSNAIARIQSKTADWRLLARRDPAGRDARPAGHHRFHTQPATRPTGP